MSEKSIWLDMDGTIADLYGVEKWKESLDSFSPDPYIKARPLINMSLLARYLNKLQKQGYKICIVSWLSRVTNATYDKLVTEAKTNWLKKHLSSVSFNQIDIIPYGTPKGKGRKGILFDDELRNRSAWGEGAHDVNNILEVLKKMLNEVK